MFDTLLTKNQFPFERCPFLSSSVQCRYASPSEYSITHCAQNIQSKHYFPPKPKWGKQWNHQESNIRITIFAGRQQQGVGYIVIHCSTFFQGKEFLPSPFSNTVHVQSTNASFFLIMGIRRRWWLSSLISNQDLVGGWTKDRQRDFVNSPRWCLDWVNFLGFVYIC